MSGKPAPSTGTNAATTAPLPGTLGKKHPEVFESPESADVGVEEEKKETLDGRKLAQQEEQKKSDDIVRNELRPQLAFEHFAGKMYDLSNADFSDSLRAKLQQASSTRSEITAFTPKERAFESPLERFNRLKDELQSFQSELKQLSETGKKDDTPSSVAAMLVREVSTLDKELQSVASNPNFQPFISQSFTDKAWAEQKNLMDKLAAELERSASSVKAGDASDPGKATFEIYFNPQKEAARQQMNVADVDRRIATLEKVVGSINLSEQAAGFGDIHTTLQTLRRKLELLDQNKLDTIYRRTQTLMGELELFQKQKDKTLSSGSNAQNQERINNMYDMMTKWDEAAASLPAVIARLQSLKDLHEQSAAALLRFSSVETQSNQLSQVLQQDKDALAKVERNLADNLKTIQGNIKAVQDRIDSLAKKL